MKSYWTQQPKTKVKFGIGLVPLFVWHYGFQLRKCWPREWNQRRLKWPELQSCFVIFCPQKVQTETPSPTGFIQMILLLGIFVAFKLISDVYILLQLWKLNIPSSIPMCLQMFGPFRMEIYQWRCVEYMMKQLPLTQTEKKRPAAGLIFFFLYKAFKPVAILNLTKTHDESKRPGSLSLS